MRWLLPCVLLMACSEGGPRASEAGMADRPSPGEGLPLPGEGQSRYLIDFVVQGCGERTPDHCGGALPLSLTFSAVLEAEPLSLSWDFGDGSPTQSGRVVGHTYAEPGSFTVTLGAVASAGPLIEQKLDFVQVKAVGPGAACSSDKACQVGSCVCRDSCPFPLSEGLCLSSCQTIACQNPGTVCIDLRVPDLAAAAPWRTQLCLPTCASDKDCRAGFLCRQARASGGWTNACVPPFPRDVGAPCRRGDGAPDPSLCLGGICLDLGASGYCSAVCSDSECPSGTRCARLGSAGPLRCLVRCGAGSCESDPWLACQKPSAAGQYGFEIVGPADPPGARYCAPKRCTLDSECGASGRCDQGKGGFCVGAQTR